MLLQSNFVVCGWDETEKLLVLKQTVVQCI